jgi:RNA polymerase sigma factor (sigma-70 family)
MSFCDRNDIVSSALYGLNVAASRFDPKKKNRFCTYAYMWIIKYILLQLKPESKQEEFDRKYSCSSIPAESQAEITYGRDDTGDKQNEMIDYAEEDRKDIESYGSANEIGKDDGQRERKELLERILSFTKDRDKFSKKDEKIFQMAFIKNMKNGDIAKKISSSISEVENAKKEVTLKISRRFGRSWNSICGRI